jgi:GT2 family glycosyltransferase
MASPTEITASVRSIAVLLTCFNRREKTLNCLRRLEAQDLPAGHRLAIFLVDDGCTDGTGAAVRAEFPHVRVIQGSGSLYWAGGMRLAWAEAAKTQPDYFLLLNDDTEIVPEAVATLLSITGAPGARVIAVAAIADSDSGDINYGAYRDFKSVQKSVSGKENCDAFNANCALVTQRVFDSIGNLDPAFTHGLADFDYGLRAKKSGINVIQSELPLGSCQRNSKKGTWQDVSLSFTSRWKLIHRPTGLPPREWLKYCIRHTEWKWPIYFISPYLRMLIK